MSTTNTYQGLNSEKNSSRVLQQPGGNSSNIFGHYEEESQRDNQMRRQRETQAVMSSNNQGNGGDGNVNFMENKDSFAANRDRSQGGGGAPFATSGSMVTAGYERPTAHQSVVGDDFITPKQQQAANKSRNQGHGAPFATGDNGPAPYQGQQVIGDDYQTPKQRQANNPNKSGNSFNNLFGDSEGGAMGSKTQGQAYRRDCLSPNDCLDVRANPITGLSPYLPSPPANNRGYSRPYNPVGGILPPTPDAPASNFQNYRPRQSVLPMGAGVSEGMYTGDRYTSATAGRVPYSDNKDRNPLTGEGVRSKPSSAIKCFSSSNECVMNRNILTGSGFRPSGFYNTSIGGEDTSPPPPAFHHQDPLHWRETANLGNLSLQDEVLPIKVKGQGVRSEQQVSTHNPVTWEAYSNFDAAKDGPKHRSRYENFADARTGTFNPITGQDTDGQKSSTKVANPPGGASSIQF